MNVIVDFDVRQKQWTTLAAKACLKGWQVWRSDAADGPTRYFVACWGQVRVCADLAELERFLARIFHQRHAV